jgi:hypothetical protein
MVIGIVIIIEITQLLYVERVAAVSSPIEQDMTTHLGFHSGELAEFRKLPRQVLSKQPVGFLLAIGR